MDIGALGERCVVVARPLADERDRNARVLITSSRPVLTRSSNANALGPTPMNQPGQGHLLGTENPDGFI